MEQLLVGLLSAAIGRQLAIGRWAGPRLTLKWHWKPTVACPYVPRPLPLQLLSLWLLIFVHFIDDVWRFLRKFQDFQSFLKRFFIRLIKVNYYLLFISVENWVNWNWKLFELKIDFLSKFQEFFGLNFRIFQVFSTWGFFRIFQEIFCQHFRIFPDFSGFWVKISGFFRDFLFKFQDFYVISS